MDLARNVEGFFHDEVDRAFRDEGLSPGTLVEHYIVQLLAELRRAADRGQAAGAADAGGDRGASARAPARSCARSATRRSTCRGSGASTWPAVRSTSTTTSGWAARRTASWRAAAPAGPAIRSASVFGELAVNFVRFVGALALVSRRMAVPASNQDVVRLYRRWQRDQERVGGAPGWRRWAWCIGRGRPDGLREGRRRRAGRRRTAVGAGAAAARARGALPGRDAPGDRRVRDRRGERAAARRRRARRASSCWSDRRTASSASGCSSTRAALANLERHDPATRLDETNFADFCLAVEGVSHFIYVALRAADDRGVSQLELELQAEVDKFACCVLVAGRRIPTCAGGSTATSGSPTISTTTSARATARRTARPAATPARSSAASSAPRGSTRCSASCAGSTAWT